jgi:hypothetical protein
MNQEVGCLYTRCTSKRESFVMRKREAFSEKEGRKREEGGKEEKREV